MATTAFATNNNISKLAGAGKSNELPNLGAVASAVTAFAEQMNKYQEAVKGVDMDTVSKSFINSFKLYTNVIKSLSSVDADVFKKFKSANVINSITEDFQKLLQSLADGFASMTQHMGQGDVYNKLKEVLTPSKTTKDYRNTNENGIGLTNTETTETGSLIDCVNMILNVYKQMGEIKTNGPFSQMFKRVKNKAIIATFKNDVLYVFENVWEATMTTFLPFTDNRKVQTTYLAIKSLEKVTLSLPALLEKLAEPMIYLGRKYQSKKILKTFELLVGKGDVVAETKSGKAHKDYLVGVVMDMLESFTLIEESYGNSLTKVNKMLGDFSSTLNSLAISMTALGVLSIPISLGLLVMVGFTGKGGLVGVLTKAMTMLAKESKDISQASKSLMMMSASILLLTSTAVLISLTGAFVIQSWATIGVTFGFVAVLVSLMWLLGSKVLKNEIQSGTKTILLLSSALALISLTAVMLVMTGQLITADWDSILQVGAMVVGLGVTMWILSHMKDTILESTKTILLLGLAIGLISLIAVGLVWVSQYLDGNWEQIGMFGVVFVGIVTVMLLASYLAQKIDMEGIVTISICIMLSTVSILLLATTIRIAGDMASLLSAAGIMAGIITVFSALAIGLGAIGPMVVVGAIVLGVIVGIVVTASVAMNLVAKAAKTIKETGYDTEGLKTVIKMPFEAVLGLFELLDTINPIQLALTTVKMYGLMSITSNIGRMASVLQDIAQLRMPEDFDKEGRPIGYRKMTVSDFVLAGQNAAAVATVLTNMFSEDGENKQVTIAGQTITLSTINLGNIAHLRNRHKRRMERLALITDSIGKMATVIRDIASLSIPIYDSSGKQTGIRQMTVDDFNTATENAATIVKTLTGIFVDPRVIVATKLTDKDDAETVGAVLSAVGNLSSVTNVLALLADGNIPLETKTENGKIVVGKTVPLSNILDQQDTISSNISTLLLMIIKGVTNVDEDLIDDASDRVEDLNEVVKCTVDSTKYVVEWYNTTLKDIDVDNLNKKYEGTNKTLSGLVELFSGKKFTSSSASSFDKQTKSLVEVLKQVNGTDVNKLKYTYSLVSKLADFARSIRGDFDKLAECISEDLLDAIKELNETLNGTPKNINVTTTTADMTPSKSGTDKDTSKTITTNNENVFRERIASLERELEMFKHQQQVPKFKIDPSTGAMVVKMIN